MSTKKKLNKAMVIDADKVAADTKALLLAENSKSVAAAGVAKVVAEKSITVDKKSIPDKMNPFRKTVVKKKVKKLKVSAPEAKARLDAENKNKKITVNKHPDPDGKELQNIINNKNTVKKNKSMPKKLTLELSAVKRTGTLLFVDPKKIIIPSDYNPRFDYGDMKSLIESIKNNGYFENKPVEVYRDGDSLVLQDGFRRMRAVLSLIEKGQKVGSIPITVIEKKLSLAERLARTLVNNSGKPLTPLEEADAYNRMIQEKMDEKQIGKLTGQSVSTIKRRLILVNASPKLREAINKEEIGVVVARQIVELAKDDLVKQDVELSKYKKEQREKGKGDASKSVDSKTGVDDNKKKLSASASRKFNAQFAELSMACFRSGKKIPNIPEFKAILDLGKRMMKLKRRGKF